MAENTLVPSRTHVYLAATGSTEPATSVDALDVAFKSVGNTTPDSLSFSTEPEFEEVQSAQSDFPIRRFQTSESGTISVDLLDWNDDNFIAVYGGGTVTEPDPTTNPGEFKFVPPALGGRQEKAAVVEIIDGTKHYRYVFPRTMQVEGVETELNKSSAASLPLRLAILGDDGVDPWYLLTDDPAFDPAA